MSHKWMMMKKNLFIYYPHANFHRRLIFDAISELTAKKSFDWLLQGMESLTLVEVFQIWIEIYSFFNGFHDKYPNQGSFAKKI